METVILAIVGAVLSLTFSYYPKARTWLESFENKGAVMLALVLVVSAVYFALSCTPFAVDLGVNISCTQDGVFDMLKALFVIASGNQLAFLYSKKSG